MAVRRNVMNHWYDLIVIGSGAASIAAKACSEAGWNVAVVDSHPFGGTCALRGCVPKKVYYAAGQAMDWVGRMSGKGIVPGDIRVNWNDLQSFKRTFTNPVPEGTEQWLRSAGIDPIQGRAKFLDENTIQVNDEKYTADKFLIAAGSKPRPLQIPGAEHLITSDQFLEREHLPGHILFTGGGYISMEFAHIAARVGAKVTVLHRNQRPLPFIEPELTDLLLKTSSEVGIDIQVNTEVQAIEKKGDGYAVTGVTDGNSNEFTADMVVHGAGRVPDIVDMQLENAGVDYGSHGVHVNRYLQSQSNPDFYAAGDAAASGPPLTPVATKEGEIVAGNLLEGNHITPEYAAIPTVVFTLPPVTSVGLTESRARELKLQFQVRQDETSEWFTSGRENIAYSGYKILVEEESDNILGAHIFGPEAQEVINIFALAISQSIPASTLKEMIYTYPTSSSDIPSYL